MFISQPFKNKFRSFVISVPYVFADYFVTHGYCLYSTSSFDISHNLHVYVLLMVLTIDRVICATVNTPAVVLFSYFFLSMIFTTAQRRKLTLKIPSSMLKKENLIHALAH